MTEALMKKKPMKAVSQPEYILDIRISLSLWLNRYRRSLFASLSSTFRRKRYTLEAEGVHMSLKPVSD